MLTTLVIASVIGCTLPLLVVDKMNHPQDSGKNFFNRLSRAVITNPIANLCCFALIIFGIWVDPSDRLQLLTYAAACLGFMCSSMPSTQTKRTLLPKLINNRALVLVLLVFLALYEGVLPILMPPVAQAIACYFRLQQALVNIQLNLKENENLALQNRTLIAKLHNYTLNGAHNSDVSRDFMRKAG